MGTIFHLILLTQAADVLFALFFSKRDYLPTPRPPLLYPSATCHLPTCSQAEIARVMTETVLPLAKSSEDAHHSTSYYKARRH